MKTQFNGLPMPDMEKNIPTLRDSHTGFLISTDTKISESTFVIEDFITQILETAD